jgi:glucosylglycerate synthase
MNGAVRRSVVGTLDVETEIASALAEDTILADDLVRQLISVGEVDLLVGISAQGDAAAASRAFRAIEQSFQQRFTRQRAVIVNVCAGDAGGSDSSLSAPGGLEESDALPRNSLRTVHRLTASFSMPPSPGLALRTVLTAADLLRAKACAVVSPGTIDLTPDRIANLLAPVFRDQFDFVAPLYSRHKFQGLLARNLLYPMSRSLFCGGIRELYSDEWAFSGRLAANCLSQDVWHEESIRDRPEAWMAISAIASDFRCCQTFLGQKLPPPAGSSTDIVEVFRQTVGNLFWCMESRQSLWLDCKGSDLVQTFGRGQELTSEPSDLNPQGILEMFRNGVAELGPILSSILDPETHAQINGIVECKGGSCRFRPELWVRALYDFASSYHHSVINRDHLVQALVPLYRGMTYSYLMEHSESSADEMEAANENLCAEFARQKPYLTEKWNAKMEVKS